MEIYSYSTDIDLIQKENNSDLSKNQLIVKDDILSVILSVAKNSLLIMPVILSETKNLLCFT